MVGCCPASHSTCPDPLNQVTLRVQCLPLHPVLFHVSWANLWSKLESRPPLLGGVASGLGVGGIVGSHICRQPLTGSLSSSPGMGVGR